MENIKELAKRANAILDAMSSEELIAFIKKYEKELDFPHIALSKNQQRLTLYFQDRTIFCTFVESNDWDFGGCKLCELRHYCYTLYWEKQRSRFCQKSERKDRKCGVWREEYMLKNNLK